MSQTNAGGPLYPIEVNIKIGAFEWPYVIEALKEFARSVEGDGSNVQRLLRGDDGRGEGCSHLTVSRQDTDVQKFNAEMDDYIARVAAMPKSA